MGSDGGLVAKLCTTIVTPSTVACQVPLSLGFSRQEYWSGLPFPSPGDLPNPGIELRSPALQADSLPTELRGKPSMWEKTKRQTNFSCSPPSFFSLKLSVSLSHTHTQIHTHTQVRNWRHQESLDMGMKVGQKIGR